MKRCAECGALLFDDAEDCPVCSRTFGSFEVPMTPREIARRSGYAVSERAVREACHRRVGNQLPCYRAGATRPVLKIRWSDFCDWYDREVREAI